MGREKQAPSDERKEEPIVVRPVEEVDHDQQGVDRKKDEEMNEEAPLLENIAARRCALPEARGRGRQRRCPSREAPNKPEIVRIAIEIERGKTADYQHEHAKVDEKSARGPSLLHEPTPVAAL